MSEPRPLSWFGIVRLGMVQAGLGAVVVLATSTMNRVMVVELALPAIIPGALVALHYGVQVLRPRFGHGSDTGGRRTPWIVGGMAALALGGIGAAIATAWMASNLMAGLVLALASFALVGVGVGSAGTSLLVLLAKLVAPRRRAPAASIVWLLMIAGIAVTATIAGKLLDPFSGLRLIAVTGCVAGGAFLLSVLAVWGVEGSRRAALPAAAPAPVPFRQALRDVWAEPASRRFALFVFTSMLAYSAQELIIEPFAGAVFHLTPGESTGLNGMQHMGVLAGMLLVAVGGSLAGEFRAKSMRAWTAGGCLASAAAILVLAASGLFAPNFPLRGAVLVLGAANGAFAVSAIGAMMGLAGAGRESRAGVRMGLWGAAQALAFGAGGLVGTGASDLARLLLGSPSSAYAAVFIVEAGLFTVAARQAALVFAGDPAPARLGGNPMREAT
jgi:BCD family chlorophyll transporter-like MFS transporter